VESWGKEQFIVGSLAFVVEKIGIVKTPSGILERG